jgi:hypothetical protein
MDHRTYGETKNCKGCRYWSEMLAHCGADTGGSVAAMCLSPDSPKKGIYTTSWMKCDRWASGHLGAVDEPGQDPRAYELETEGNSGRDGNG